MTAVSTGWVVTAARWGRPAEGALAALRRRPLKLSQPLSCGSGCARGRTSQRARPMGPRKAGSFPATSDRCRPAHRPARRAPVGLDFSRVFAGHARHNIAAHVQSHCHGRCAFPHRGHLVTRLPRRGGRVGLPKGPWAAPQLTPFPPCRRLEGCPRGRRPQGADGTPRAGDRCGEWDEVSRPSLHPVSSPRPVLRVSAVTGSVRARPSRGLSSTDILALADLQRSTPAGLCRAAERDKEVSRRGTGGSSCASLGTRLPCCNATPHGRSSASGGTRPLGHTNAPARA